MDLVIKNLLNGPLVCFLFGVVGSILKKGFTFPKKLHQILTLSILFLIGMKGGGPLVEHFSDEAPLLLAALVFWGLIHPFIAYYLLRYFTKTDSLTAAAISASFGSISVMTFAAGAAFLENQEIGFQKVIIGILAILEVPAIISGLFLAKRSGASANWKKMFFEALVNKTILTLFAGLAVGAMLYLFDLQDLSMGVCFSFKPLLCLFLLDMGLHVGLHRAQFKNFSWGLTCFGLYMPLIGASAGIFLSYCLGLDLGTATLIAVLLASASYIAVPAAMRIALPMAKESIYLPLALGITFPFNIFVGIPLYYAVTRHFW